MSADDGDKQKKKTSDMVNRQSLIINYHQNRRDGAHTESKRGTNIVISTFFYVIIICVLLTISPLRMKSRERRKAINIVLNILPHELLGRRAYTLLKILQVRPLERIC
jgi:hypothetical protein